MKINEAVELINPAIRTLNAYHLKPDNVAVKLNQNENPFDWPAEIKQEVAEFCRKRPWNRYPDFIPADLKKALADYAGVQPENVLAGNGSNEMLLVLLLSLASPKRPLITCQPTFTVYRLLASGLGCDCEPVMLTDDLRFDIDAICAASRKRPEAVLLLCSPNNPTGSALNEREIRTVLDCHRGFVILDQAYVEFGAYNAVPLLKEYPNLIVTRTFSKAFAAAGLRLGYMISAPDVALQVNKIKLPYNINFLAEYIATVMLSHRDIMQQRIEYIIQQRGRVNEELRSLPLKAVYETHANFILIRTDKKDALLDFLARKDIRIRDVSGYPMLETCLRISIGSEEENSALLSSLKEFYSSNA